MSPSALSNISFFVKEAALIENMSAWERTRVMNLLHGGSLQERTGLALLKCLFPWDRCCLCRVQSCSYAHDPSTSCSQQLNCFAAGPAEINPNRIPLKDIISIKVRQGMRQSTDPVRRDAHHPRYTARSVNPRHSEQWGILLCYNFTICKTAQACAVLVILSCIMAFCPNNNKK